MGVDGRPSGAFPASHAVGLVGRVLVIIVIRVGRIGGRAGVVVDGRASGTSRAVDLAVSVAGFFAAISFPRVSAFVSTRVTAMLTEPVGG